MIILKTGIKGKYGSLQNGHKMHVGRIKGNYMRGHCYIYDLFEPPVNLICYRTSKNK